MLKKISRLVYVVFALVIIYSCDKEDAIELENLTENQVFLNDSKDLSTITPQLNAQVDRLEIAQGLTQITNYSISYDKILKKTFIVADGVDKAGNSVNFRQEVILTKAKSNDGEILTINSSQRGESCSGVNCTHCKVKEGGGCNCLGAGDPSEVSYCNHKVTTGDQ